WRKANPSLGVTVDEEVFALECEEARQSPAKENAFRRYLLNQWTEQAVRWLSMGRWDECAGPVDPAALSGRECYAGLDLSTPTDLSALVLLFPDGAGGYDLLPFFWAPGEGARQREKRDRVPYDAWIRRGLVRATEGDVIDYDVIRRDVNDLGKRFRIREIA